MNLYTSDLHFGHTNAIGFDHRPFADRDEMDRVMIELWNGRVQQNDTVDNSTEHWLSDIEIKLDYKWWYVGHYHTSRITDGRF